MYDFELLERLLELNVGISQKGNETALELMRAAHPRLEIKRYASGREHNGWVVPREWVVHKAEIRRGGNVIFDGTVHPMAVAGYSSSFRGVVSREELEKHVFHNKAFPDSYAFHCTFNYRPWVQHWGFCVPYNVFRSWGPGDYEVELDVEFRDGHLVLGEWRHEGELPDTIVFNAHTCHPTQANDDMAGVVLLLELFEWLGTRRTRYSYRAILAPEHVGTVFYVADLPEDDLARLKLGCFVEMVGTDTPLALQRSFTGDSAIDRIAEYVLAQVQPDLVVGAFRTIVGNDETVWEAPGIEIPTISISRFPYPEYHTSEDGLKIIREAKVTETLEALKRMILILEDDRTIERRFTGLVALSNPRYGLYVERPEPTVDKKLTEMDLRLGKLQDYLPRFFDGTYTIFQIAQEFDVPFEVLRAYLARFEEKRLVELRALARLEQYEQAGTFRGRTPWRASGRDG